MLGRFEQGSGATHLESATHFAVILAWLAGVVAIAFLVGLAVSWRGWLDQLLRIMIIGAITWLCASMVRVAERRVIARFGGGDGQVADGDRQRRRIRTQVMTLRRLGIALVILLGFAAAAAQTSLGSVFAGMQISFSDAIRVGDVVVIEEQLGRIEEITLTYVVIQIWDQRRLVLPTAYFTTTSYENWTRNATELFGTVEFDVDFTVPLDVMRAELDRLLAASEFWDGRAGSVAVTDAVGGHRRLRITVSASDSGALLSLRCAVREGIVGWLRRAHPAALPRWRVEPSPTPRADRHLLGAAAGRFGGADDKDGNGGKSGTG